MSRTKKIVIAAAAVVLIAALTLTLCLTLLRQPEPVRDMSEVASRGSFVMKVESQRAILPFVGGESFVFQTYEEFTASPLSELILYSDYENISEKCYEFSRKTTQDRNFSRLIEVLSSHRGIQLEKDIREKLFPNDTLIDKYFLEVLS